MMRKIALVLEYEGTAYAGFQRQANAPSVQAAVEQAVRLLTGRPDRVCGAGRTDAGVHAAGQVVAFETGSVLATETFLRGLNHLLPEDISVREAWEAASGFDPRRDALARVYRYAFLVGAVRSALRRRFLYPVRPPLELEAMARALAHLEGERDFAPFAAPVGTGRPTMRRLYRTALEPAGDELHLELEGNAFLPQQVRRIGGAVLRVGLGKLTLEGFVSLADCGRPGAAQWVLPARGLCLLEVKYPAFPPGSYARIEDNRTYAAGAR